MSLGWNSGGQACVHPTPHPGLFPGFIVLLQPEIQGLCDLPPVASFRLLDLVCPLWTCLPCPVEVGDLQV